MPVPAVPAPGMGAIMEGGDDNPMSSMGRKVIWLALLVGVAGILIWAVYSRLIEGSGAGTGRRGGGASPPAAVEVAPIERGSISLRRTFSGALESKASLMVAPKVSGRVEQLHADIGDPVRRGRVVAELDNDEYVQAVAGARADLAVARANLAEAKSALEIASRELDRKQTLRRQQVISASELDAAQAVHLEKRARVEVAEAEVIKAEATSKTAEIRLGYTTVTADWTGGGDERVVAERFVDDGELVAANAPLMAIVALDPVTAVFFVAERDYVHLRIGQPATLTTDAYPADRFTGEIARIAPVFKESTRQARVELEVANPDARLKPGMFIRATVVLDRADDAVLVPDSALTTRRDETGVFVVTDDGQRVAWRPVRAGIRDGGRVQVTGEGLTGRVVTLGQQLVDDGSTIVIPDEAPPEGTAGPEAPRS